MTMTTGTRRTLHPRPCPAGVRSALLGGLGLAVAGCSGGNDSRAPPATTKGRASTSSTSTTSGATTTTTGTTATVTSLRGDPRGDRRPVPGRRLERPDVLTESGIVRSDIRSSFGGASGDRRGRAVHDPAHGRRRRPTAASRSPAPRCTCGTATATAATRCTPGVADENYLRGVQEADANGVVTFTSIFPACYSGRWPHVHFEVYPSLDAATSGASKLATSQIALPEDVCDAVYATDGYEQSVTQPRAGLARRPTWCSATACRSQTPSMTGNATSGYVSSLVVGVSGTV